MNDINSRQDPSGLKIGFYALVLVASLAAFAVVFGGWSTVSDATRDEQVRHDLKDNAIKSFRTNERIDALEKRVKALEARP